ncbi:uncharacterized protein BCR38DRAFT_340131 [Pseudomassariella vexata]|uniref:Uncharacterized protein n=1 Tax=Pseudomassariella vexata TaxID=1141098 RepID=A0A1Y2E517_9PEZI|nr:uncharacterized protein BCR38DRAFT_340131 [Pseudomassariella vexata]ORY66454.1 hypothetical protein BCR38DRAFT_340131 [Pseudomassariella vexata]
MCLTTHHRSRNCGHHWLQIARPCYPEMGFNTCDTFGNGVAREPSDEFVWEGMCPACAHPGMYDKNYVRMIIDIKNKWRWGLGPCKDDPGVECVVM